MDAGAHLDANANGNVSVVDCFATILNLAQNFLATMRPVVRILQDKPSYINGPVAHTLDTAFVPIPGHLHAQTNTQTVHVYTSRASIADHGQQSTVGRTDTVAVAFRF